MICCDVAAQLVDRRIDAPGFAVGVRRFAIGLGKKVLVANSVAVAADAIFGLPAGQLTAPVAWFGLLAYTLQIYFDFSGYSDMAIGLGRMLGFHLPENFDYPYTARSVRDFWRRWHITLSTWFRDYLFVPLGGSRRGSAKTYRNLLLVFLLCGLWHGAAWTFVAWGLWHGAFLVLERLAGVRPAAPPARGRSWLAHGYTLGVVGFGWVLFRCNGIGHAGRYFLALAGGNELDVTLHPLVHFVDAKLLTVVALALVGCGPWLRRATQRWDASAPGTLALARSTAVALLLLASAMTLSAGTHNPFIYFRF
jgi:alginate O-acetyltransferase complex protein AlgI